MFSICCILICISSKSLMSLLIGKIIGKGLKAICPLMMISDSFKECWCTQPQVFCDSAALLCFSCIKHICLKNNIQADVHLYISQHCL